MKSETEIKTEIHNCRIEQKELHDAEDKIDKMIIWL